MRQLANGWTKDKVLAQIKKYNNGTRALKESSDHVCIYQATDGNRCAIGCFIPYGHIALSSREVVIQMLIDYPAVRSLMPFDQGEDLIDFQLAHDYYENNGFASVYDAIENFLKDCVDSEK